MLSKTCILITHPRTHAHTRTHTHTYTHTILTFIIVTKCIINLHRAFMSIPLFNKVTLVLERGERREREEREREWSYNVLFITQTYNSLLHSGLIYQHWSEVFLLQLLFIQLYHHSLFVPYTYCIKSTQSTYTMFIYRHQTV